jgi:hypothetical protein
LKEDERSKKLKEKQKEKNGERFKKGVITPWSREKDKSLKHFNSQSRVSIVVFLLIHFLFSSFQIN